MAVLKQAIYEVAAYETSSSRNKEIQESKLRFLFDSQ
jgi:hypothetical protein